MEKTVVLNFLKCNLAFWDEIKKEFDVFDKKEASCKIRENFLIDKKNSLFPKFDKYFDLLWEHHNSLDVEEKLNFKIEYERLMYLYLGNGIEINTHIRSKPLGYGGDFITMNYIYDYHADKFLGDTTYRKLINHYTCNIDVSCSNIARKALIKKAICDVLDKNKKARILSIGAGSAREIEELIKEGKINSDVSFYLVDFEAKAVEYVRNWIKEYNLKSAKIELIKTDLINLLKNDKFRKTLSNMDLIYISGVFDYLSDRICKKITKDIAQLLNEGCSLMIANMSIERQRHRAYYELFGEWNMYHRTEKEVLGWVRDLSKDFRSEIMHTNCKSYHFLQIKRA